VKVRYRSGRDSLIDDARTALSRAENREVILAAFTEWWRESGRVVRDESGGGDFRPTVEQLAQRLHEIGRADLATVAVGPWTKQGPVEQITCQFAILLGESVVGPFVETLKEDDCYSPNFFGLDALGARDAFDVALRSVLRVNLSFAEAGLRRLRAAVENAKCNPTATMPQDERYGAAMRERVTRYLASPEIDEVWEQPSDIPMWPEHSILWGALLEVRPEDTMALLGAMPHPRLMRSCLECIRLAESPEEVASIIRMAPNAVNGASFEACGAVAVLLLDIAWRAIERIAHGPDGSLFVAPLNKPELLADIAEKCRTATEIILNSLFSRSDAVPLAWAWLERMYSHLRLLGMRSVDRGSLVVNLPMLSIQALARRLQSRDDHREWINQRDSLRRIHRLGAVIAVSTFEQESNATRTESLLEWALIEGNFDYASIGDAMTDAGDVIGYIGGQAICTFEDPPGWLAAIWQRLRPVRERNWRAGPRADMRNISGELCALWSIVALEHLPPNRRKEFWASIELAIRDGWQTDTYGYAPNWSKALFRLFKMFEAVTDEGSLPKEQQLSRALLPYIEPVHGFVDLVIDLRDHGWSIEFMREAVAFAGFNLGTLITQFVSMKERMFKFPQANKERIAKYRELAE
jgi:hypothetical protein